jgi:hypothetical protein
MDAGMTEIPLYFNWVMVEQGPGQYSDGDLVAANNFFPRYGMRVSFMITPITANKVIVPPDLQGLPIDDPYLIARFNAMLDYFASKTPDIDVATVLLGNEIDAYLGMDGDAWRQYAVFYEQTSTHARHLWPDARISVQVQYSAAVGRQSRFVRAINSDTDFLCVSYYPLWGLFWVKQPAVVHEDFDIITAMYPDMEIEFSELGYPAHRQNRSSREKQEQFIRETFRAWDDHECQVKKIVFTWMHDWNPDVIRLWMRLYGVPLPSFGYYLGSLGLRTYHGDGMDKPAWVALEEEAAIRNFGMIGRETRPCGQQ